MKKIIYLLPFLILLSSCVTTEPTEPIKEKIATELDVPSNEFEISGMQDTMLFGEEGTAIFVPKDALVFEDGTKPTGPVKVSLKEYYATSSIVAQNLTTLSKGKMLETGGMLNLNATSEGKKLKVKRGKDLLIHFPKNGNKKEMDLFSGEKDENGQVVWNKEKTDQERLKDNIIAWYTKYENLDDKTLYLADGQNAYNWIHKELKFTKPEQEYFKFRDINLYYKVNPNGKLSDIHFKKKIPKKISKRLLAIMDKIPLLKPYTIKGKPIAMQGHFELKVIVTPPSYAKNKGYLNSIKQKYPAFEKQSINKLSQAELHYFIFNSAKLGWLNCDRFLKIPGKKVDMAITLEKPEDLMIKMIYKDFKSVIPPTFEDGTSYFRGIPADRDITLMIIRNEKDKIQMSITEQKTVDGAIDSFDFKDYTMGELKTELEKLN